MAKAAEKWLNVLPKGLMFKVIVLLFLTAVSFSAAARPCKVDGISDSPQRFDCSFPKTERLQLKCLKGIYFINNNPIEMAYHLEVEEGSSPLVFKAKKVTLTVTEENGKFHAEAELGNAIFTGSCL